MFIPNKARRLLDLVTKDRPIVGRWSRPSPLSPARSAQSGLAAQQQVALGEEMAFAQKYLDIQKVRFAERLQLSVDVPRELYPAQVPSLILQPMVENAVKHGIAKRAQGGAIRIAASRCDGVLTLSVCNDGPSLPVGWEMARSGIGMSNVRTRLESLYGDAFELSMRNQDAGGVEVSVSLPFAVAAAGGEG